MKTGSRIRLAAVAGLVLILTGCFGLDIESGVRDPDAYFAKAHREIESLGRNGRGRDRRAHTLCLLVYDRGERQVVRLSVPMWIVEAGVDAGAAESHGRRDFDLGKRYDVDWRAIKDLGSFGPGLLVSIEDEKDRVLIWLK
jgi:hypothetical protein